MSCYTVCHFCGGPLDTVKWHRGLLTGEYQIFCSEQCGDAQVVADTLLEDDRVLRMIDEELIG